MLSDSPPKWGILSLLAIDHNLPRLSGEVGCGMKLNIIVDDYSMNLNLPDGYLTSSVEAFDRLDRNMDNGVQFGRQWLEHPNPHQRCQVAADKLLTALETNNENLALLSAGYIFSRIPGVRRVIIDNSGELQGTVFE